MTRRASRPLRRGSRVVLAALVLAASGVSVAAGEAPAFTVTPAGHLVLHALPEVVSRPEVRPHLESGLTTTFLFEVTARHQRDRTRGAARIDVRWEPWDEVFLVTQLAADGVARRATLPSLEALAAWWQELELPVALGLPRGPRPEVRVDLRVVPFSEAEQLDAQRWLADAVGRGRLGDSPGAAGRGPQPPQGGGQDPGGDPGGAFRPGSTTVVELLLATSIQRRSVVRYAWTAAPWEPPSQR